MKKVFLYGLLFGALLIPVSTLGLAVVTVEVVTMPLLLVPKLLVLHTMQVSEYSAVVTISLFMCISGVFYGLVAIGLLHISRKTSKNIAVIIAVTVYAVLLFGGIRTSVYAPTAQNPEGNTGASCSKHDECVTPMSYLVRSVCPYSSLCIEGTCRVVCPIIRYPESVSAACNSNDECNCSRYSANATCACVDNMCVAIVE